MISVVDDSEPSEYYYSNCSEYETPRFRINEADEFYLSISNPNAARICHHSTKSSDKRNIDM